SSSSRNARRSCGLGATAAAVPSVESSRVPAVGHSGITTVGVSAVAAVPGIPRVRGPTVFDSGIDTHSEAADGEVPAVIGAASAAVRVAAQVGANGAAILDALGDEAGVDAGASTRTVDAHLGRSTAEADLAAVVGIARQVVADAVLE